MEHHCFIADDRCVATDFDLISTNDGSTATDDGSVVTDDRSTPMDDGSIATDDTLSIDAPLEHYYRVIQDPLCDVCDRPGQWLCGKCRSIRYCSRKCQLIAARCHNGLCAVFESIRPLLPDMGRSDCKRYVALINAEGVHILYIEFATVILPDGKHCIAPSENVIWGQELLGKGLPVPEFRSSVHVGRSCVSGDIKTEWRRPLGRRLVFMTRSLVYLKWQGPNLLHDKAWVNSETVHAFGPAVLYVTSVDGESPLDITAGDIHHFKENLRDNLLATSESDYALEKYMEQEQAKMVGPRFAEGLRINCKGDQVLNHRPPLEPVLIPYSFITTKSEDLRPPVAQKLNIPLMTHVIKRDRNYSCNSNSKPLDPTSWENETALQLLQECDSRKGQWMSMLYNALTRNGEYANLNTIIFVRDDWIPLSADLVEGIINYTLDEVRPRFKKVMDMESGAARTRVGKNLLRDINERKFAQYYEKWLEMPRECRRHPDTYPWLLGMTK